MDYCDAQAYTDEWMDGITTSHVIFLAYRENKLKEPTNQEG